MLWPGVAEELLGGKAYMVRDGVFNGVDAVLFTHVGNNLQTAWGQPNGTGMVSVEYTFKRRVRPLRPGAVARDAARSMASSS